MCHLVGSFFLLSEGAVTGCWKSVSNILMLIFSSVVESLSLTLGCHTSTTGVQVVRHVVVCPRSTRTMYFSLPKKLYGHLSHSEQNTVFFIHPAWTFASSVLVCNNQIYLCDVWWCVHFARRDWTHCECEAWRNNKAMVENKNHFCVIEI